LYECIKNPQVKLHIIIILPDVIESETWSFALTEECKLRICGPKKGAVRGIWVKVKVKVKVKLSLYFN
jgi:hypothetical protein